MEITKTKEEIVKNIKNRYIELKEKQIIQRNYILGLINSYRVFDEETQKMFSKELYKITRINDQLYLIEELL
jgi:hypothetical protein